MEGWIGIDPMDELNQIQCRVYVTTSHPSHEVSAIRFVIWRRNERLVGKRGRHLDHKI